MTDRLGYVCGHSPAELERLALQSRVYDTFTQAALRATGLRRGLHVADLGCGAGDVSLSAGALVGPSGTVVGVDRSAAAVSTATARAAGRGLPNVRFEVGELDAWSPATRPDAVVGRFVLMHQRDPLRLLRQARRQVRPGGVVLFIESDIAACVAGQHSRPHSAIYDGVVTFWKDVLGSAGVHLDMAMRLPSLLVAAGFATPAVEWSTFESGGAASQMVPFAVESARSMLPVAARAGIAAPCGGDMDLLEMALRDDVERHGCVLSAPPVVAAWTSAPPGA